MDLRQTIIESLPPKIVPVGMRGAFAMRSLLYRGSRYACPCCGNSFRHFLSYGPHFGDGARQLARCPGCNSFERHRLLWLYMQENTNLFTEHLRVLHFAPEYSMQRRMRKLPNLKYTTADLGSPLADEHYDICDIPHADASFDVVLCNHVLEHIPDDLRAMRELRRVLRPDGWAILQVPIDTEREHTFEDPAITTPQAREAAYGRHDHVRMYGRDYADRLRSAGFQVEVVRYFDGLDAETVRERCLRREEDIHHCTAAL